MGPALQGGEEGRSARDGRPQLHAAHRLAHAQFTAQLASLLLSAVSNVIAPDLASCELPPFETLVVPLIVLRDHTRFDPLDGGHARAIDVDAIGAQVQRLLLPEQRVQLLPSVHQLHDHPQLAVAIRVELILYAQALCIWFDSHTSADVIHLV